MSIFLLEHPSVAFSSLRKFTKDNDLTYKKRTSCHTFLVLNSYPNFVCLEDHQELDPVEKTSLPKYLKLNFEFC